MYHSKCMEYTIIMWLVNKKLWIIKSFCRKIIVLISGILLYSDVHTEAEVRGMDDVTIGECGIYPVCAHTHTLCRRLNSREECKQKFTKSPSLRFCYNWGTKDNVLDTNLLNSGILLTQNSGD